MRLWQLLRSAATVVLITLIVVGIAVAIHQIRPPGYTAEAVLVVPSNAAAAARSPRTYAGPGLEDQAQKLALTFAGLIPSDQAILQLASQRLGRSTSEVQSRLTVLNDANTAIVRIRYKGQNSAEALLGASVVARAVSGPHPVSSAVPPGALMLIRLPTKTTSAYTLGVLIGVAVVLGLALGVLLVVLRERADPRLNRPRDLSALLGRPVVATRRLSDQGCEELLETWRRLADPPSSSRDGGDPVKISLLPATRGAEKASRRLVNRMTRSLGATQDEERPGEPLERREQDDGIFAGGGAAGTGLVSTAMSESQVRTEETQASAPVEVIKHRWRVHLGDHNKIAHSDVLVLVVGSGARSRSVSRLVDRVDEVGREFDAAILADGFVSGPSAS